MVKKVQKQTTSPVVKRQPGQSNALQLPDIFGQSFLPAWWRGFPSETTLWAPAINIQEKEDRFVAKVELPGVNEDDISVEVVGDSLMVEGEKRAESEVKKKGYYYSETSYGSFSRAIAIPSNVDTEKIEANFDKGVLEIELPKAVKVEPKKVKVTTQKKSKETVENKTEKPAKKS